MLFGGLVAFKFGVDAEGKSLEESLTEAVTAALGKDHDVELRVERSGRKRAFVALSEQADLIVLGAPRKMAAGPMFAHRLVSAAHCPVVVMPPEPTGPSVVQKAAGSAGRSLAKAAGTAGRPGIPPRPPATR